MFYCDEAFKLNASEEPPGRAVFIWDKGVMEHGRNESD